MMMMPCLISFGDDVQNQASSPKLVADDGHVGDDGGDGSEYSGPVVVPGFHDVGHRKLAEASDSPGNKEHDYYP
jgi:hypothetical protein